MRKKARGKGRAGKGARTALEVLVDRDAVLPEQDPRRLRDERTFFAEDVSPAQVLDVPAIETHM